MITEAIQPSRLHSAIHYRYPTHLGTGQRSCRRSFSRRIRHCATILRRIGRIAGQRRRVQNTPGFNHRPAARETINPR
jgi:hypothetical protein